MADAAFYKWGLFLAIFYLGLIVVEKLSEALEVNDFALAEEFNYLVYVGVIGHTENIVVGSAGFLFRSQIFRNVGDRVGFRLDISRRERYSCRRSGIYGIGVIYIISARTIFIEALCSLAVGKLSYDAAYYLKVRQLFRAYICQKSLSAVVGHCESLREVSQRSGQLAVGASILT